MKPYQTIPMKPYRFLPIEECGEPLVPIPKGVFAFFDPHPYVTAGAPFGDVSPWTLRKGVLQALERAQINLQQVKPGWKIMIHNTIRPNKVQAFMVEREYGLQAREMGLDLNNLTSKDQENLDKKVLALWAVPSDDPATPPPHSTGAVIDCTLADESGREVGMGGAIDENADYSSPDYYVAAKDEIGKRAHANRELLHTVMSKEGFYRLKSEWWHFSLGDQYWASREREAGRNPKAVALYGRADLV